MKLKDWIIVALKGIGMGAANSVPGVSGGTIAFITGIYGRLVTAINHIDAKAVKMLFTGDFKGLWKHVDGNFLLALFTGVLIAMFSFAKLIVWCMDAYPVHTWGFFFGLIIASGVVMLRSTTGWKAADLGWLVLGAVLGVFICTLQGSESAGNPSLLYVLLCGAVSICAMILPGVSGSLLLQVMGEYRYIMVVIADVLTFDWNAIIALCVFGVGCVTGLLAFSKLLHFLMDRYARPTMVALTGFVLGSLVKVWPWRAEYLAMQGGDPLLGGSAPADLHIAGGIVCIILGIALVLGLEWLGSRGKKDAE